MSRIATQIVAVAPLCLIAAAAQALPANYPAGVTNTALVSSTAVNVPYMERMEQVATNGNGGAGITNQWGGHQPRVTHHNDGTVRLLYVANNPAGGLYWVLMRRSAAAQSDWSQEAIGTSYDDLVLLRDPVSDKAHVVAWPNSVPTVYSSPSFGAATIPGSWQVFSPNSRHYSAVGIGADGTVCLKASVELTSSVPTSSANTVYQCGKQGSTGTWTWQAQQTQYIGLRHAYDYMFPGGFGQMNQLVATAQRDLYKTAAGLPYLTNPYVFNGTRWYTTATNTKASWTQADTRAPIYAASTATVAPTARQIDSFIDSSNRAWSIQQTIDPTNAVPSGLYAVIANSAGTVLYSKKLPIPSYGFARVFEDAKGRRWLLWTNQGSQATQATLYRVTDTGGSAPTLTLSNAVDLSRAFGAYSINAAPTLALPRGGQTVGNVVEGSFAACEGTYVAGQSLVCSPSGTGVQRVVHFRIRLPD
jgi:hypothetical protein